MTRTLFILFLSFFSVQTFAQNNVVVEIAGDFVVGCETGEGDCNPIVVERENIKDNVTLIFPSGGTQTDVYINVDKQKVVNGTGGFSEWLREAKFSDHKMLGEGKPSINLTAMPDGTYYAYMLSCAMGGGFSVILKTKT